MRTHIDDELSSLIPPLSAEEQAALEASLKAHGCRDPLVVWKGKDILLDGHHRRQICKREGIEYSTSEVECEDLEAAKLWILNNQLGRRNATPEVISYLRGLKFNLLKRKRGGDQRSNRKRCGLVSERLAKEFNVSSRTVENDGRFAQDISIAGSHMKRLALGPNPSVSRTDIHLLANMDQGPKREAVEKVLSGEVASVREFVRGQKAETADELTPQERGKAAEFTEAARSCRKSHEENLERALRVLEPLIGNLRSFICCTSNLDNRDAYAALLPDGKKNWKRVCQELLGVPEPFVNLLTKAAALLADTDTDGHRQGKN